MSTAEFDFIVIGGGAAGCVAAARLAQYSSRSVLLLEAGPDLRHDRPEEFRDVWHLTRRCDWGLKSEADELGVVLDLRRGKLLGGTSSITRFILRGAPRDYDEWVALGNPGWGFSEILPYFNRAESDLDFGDQPWHGDAGPIPVARHSNLERTAVHSALLRAFEAAGFPRVDDHNRPGALGLGPMPMNSRDGIRVDTASGYLPIGCTPANLTIRPDAQVADIVFRGTCASGVRLIDGTIIGASRIILCAGTYGSPPILLRSGVGPADHLRALGIPVRIDLPGVGANLTDHPQTALDTGFAGPTRATPILHSLATFQSRDASPQGPPDLMFWVADPAAPDTPPQLELEIVLLKPRSRGSVRLRSADPADPPRIELPNLRDPYDLERLAEGYVRAQELLHHPSLRALCTGPVAPRISDHGALLRAVRRSAYSIPHVVGTCAMGPSPAGGAVVDTNGRVHGTEGLFVVDASIMPTVPSGFTHISTIMIAERISELIAAQL